MVLLLLLNCPMHLLPKCLRDELIPAALRLCRPVYYLVKPGVMFGISLAILSFPLGAEGKKCATEDKKKKKENFLAD